MSIKVIINRLSKTKPKGLEFRQHINFVSIRLHFIYKGVLCKEVVTRREIPKELCKTSLATFEEKLKSDVTYTNRKKETILYEIERNLFSYSKHFPNSQKCKLFGEFYNAKTTIGELLQDYINKVEQLKEKSTARNYIKSIRGQLIPEFGSIPARELQPKHIRDWVYKKSLTCKRKTIANHLIPLKHVLRDAMIDGLIQTNPLDLIDLDQMITKQSKRSDYICDPFSLVEIEAILGVMEGQVKNYFTTAFFTGMRTSELIGLTWDKVNFKKKYITVDAAYVDGEMKETKTGQKGIRRILMLAPVEHALLDQKKYTSDYQEFVFHHPNRPEKWLNDKQVREWAWRPALDKARVRYRNPYQTRHSFACLMIAQNENLFWIAQQMGHTGVEMINRHYGKYIEQYGKQYKPKSDFAELIK
ncbi:tyrosine-type recombinase/integrase [Spartinivicinus poritis]|uniref:Tyrosine-type recombinase/integrase n=1 Tax=Spartinivicinus poritis TaxID=2994640 RepID=A0ABT5UEP1_9GAMM|nr:tyrosine-type recombinase/integrase [Spartinivicinus sp. A2-2]MDE1464828.1 tyrosine-type recombinase/integrase [Spartinivicinus sp. A2-2]